MLNPEERNRARKKTMRLLEHMDRTEKGLTDKLRQAEFSPEAVEDAIAYVKSYGYINDARYARTYISFRMSPKSGFAPGFSGIFVWLGRRAFSISLALK